MVMMLMPAAAVRPVRVAGLGGIMRMFVFMGMNVGMPVPAVVFMGRRGRRFRGGHMIMAVPATAGYGFRLRRFKGAGLFADVSLGMTDTAGTQDGGIAHADSPYRLFVAAVLLFRLSTFLQDNSYSSYRVKRARRFFRPPEKRFTAYRD